MPLVEENKELTGLIYMAVNKINGKKYIGQTMKTLEDRKKSHIKDSKRKLKRNMIFHKALCKYGIENFNWTILENNCNENEIDNKEKEFVIIENSKIPFGYNISDGGQKSRRISQETRDKISKTLTGRKISEEHKNILIKANTGRKRTIKAKENIKNAINERLVKKNPEIYKDKDWLYQKYIIDDLTSIEIANMLNCNSSTIIRRIRSLGIEVKKSGMNSKKSIEKAKKSKKERIESIVNFDVLYNLYIKDNKSINYISNKLKISAPTISKYIKKLYISKLKNGVVIENHG